MISRTVTAVLDAPKDDVFAYLSRVENLPEWATEFARELKYEEGKAKVVNHLGEFYFLRVAAARVRQHPRPLRRRASELRAMIATCAEAGGGRGGTRPR